jgi:hypothetical protein
MSTKRIYLLGLTLLCLIVCGHVRAQRNADFVAASNYVNLKQADSARAYIDKAMRDSAVAKDPQAWYVRGFIYKFYYITKEPNDQVSPARAEALRSLRKAMSMLPDTSKDLRSTIVANLKVIAARYHNDAARSLDTANYILPARNYQMYLEIMKQVEPGMNLKPAEIEFDLALSTIYTKLYQASPKTRATILEQDKEVLNKVLKADPNNISANINMGLLYYNQAVYLIKDSDFDTPLTSLNGIQDDQVKLFKQSLPFTEKAYELDPKKEKTLQALSGIYFGLNDYDKSKLFQEKLDQLKKEKGDQH